MLCETSFVINWFWQKSHQNWSQLPKMAFWQKSQLNLEKKQKNTYGYFLQYLWLFAQNPNPKFFPRGYAPAPPHTPPNDTLHMDSTWSLYTWLELKPNWEKTNKKTHNMLCKTSLVINWRCTFQKDVLFKKMDFSKRCTFQKNGLFPKMDFSERWTFQKDVLQCESCCHW